MVTITRGVGKKNYTYMERYAYIKSSFLPPLTFPDNKSAVSIALSGITLA